MNLVRKLLNTGNLQSEIVPVRTRCMSSYEGRARRNFLFTQEQKRQRERVGRIEKIDVQYKGVPEDALLVMNKDLSTPYNCAQHMSEMLQNRSALALIDGTTLWDMHRPLESHCSLELLHFKDSDPYSVNKAFWRTCSFLLGAVAEMCFKPHIGVALHSFPSPNVRSGSFVYDVDIDLENWQPTQGELRVISSEMIKLCQKNIQLERLCISESLALDIFKDNIHKTEQIPNISSQSPDGRITLYRVGEHIDISRGPMVGDTSFVGRSSIVAVHKLSQDGHNLYRFQGVALPKGFVVNHFAYGILENQAKKLNKTRFHHSSLRTHSEMTADAVIA